MGTHMKRIALPLHAITVSVFAGMLLLLSACGGGGGGSGGDAATGGQGSASGISLLSITFPEDLGFTSFYSSAPVGAPLSQQILFTFSGPVKGTVDSSSLMIYADPGQNYSGPLVLFDSEKNLVLGHGDYEVMGNMVVFTPSLPASGIDLSLNASIEEVPGLLPDMEYFIYVPVGSVGAISNLKSIDPSVPSSLSFTTTNKNHPSQYFTNLDQDPPQASSVLPSDGTVDFPVNGLTVISGEAPYEPMWIDLDQPLKGDDENLIGLDGDGDGYLEPNFYLHHYDPLLFGVDGFYRGLFRLDATDLTQDPSSSYKVTFHGGVGIALTDICMLEDGSMVGLAEGVIYAVPFDDPSPVELTEVLDTNMTALSGLVRSPEGMIFTVNTAAETLVRIDLESSTVTTVGTISGGATVEDLAFGLDGTLYAMRVEGEGSASPLSPLGSCRREYRKHRARCGIPERRLYFIGKYELRLAASFRSG